MPTIKYVNKASKRVSGVTTIINGNLGWNKGPLMHWANKVGLEGKRQHEAIKDAQDAGTLGHLLVEKDIQRELKQKNIVITIDEFNEEVQEMANQSFENYLVWKDAYQMKPLYTEVSMVNEKYQVGGCLDCLAKVRGEVCLVDWKTGSAVYPDHLIQGAAYIELWNHPDTSFLIEDEWITSQEFCPEKIVGGYHGLRFDKETAGFDHKHRVDLSKSWEAFKHCLALQELKKVVK